MTESEILSSSTPMCLLLSSRMRIAYRQINLVSRQKCGRSRSKRFLAGGWMLLEWRNTCVINGSSLKPLPILSGVQITRCRHRSIYRPSLNVRCFRVIAIFHLLINGLQIFPMSLYVLVMVQHSHGQVWKRHSAWQLSTPSGILIIWVTFDLPDIYTYLCEYNIIMTEMNFYLAFHSLHTV